MELRKLLDIYIESNRRIQSPQTIRVYRIALKQLKEAIGHEPTTADLTDQSLISLEKHLVGRSAYTINERTGRIKALWRWAVFRGHTRKGPTLARLPVHDPYKRAWTHQEMMQIIRAAKNMSTGPYDGVPADKWWSAWVLVQYETGERTGALLQTRWDWLVDHVLEVPPHARKGRKSAVYRLSDTAVDLLDAMKEPKRVLVWPWPMSPSAYYLHFSKLLKLSGLPDGRKNKGQRIRRTHLTFWQKGGGDATQRAQHTSVGITQRFYLDDTLLDHHDPYRFIPRILPVPDR
jgi:hypothetical protein